MYIESSIYLVTYNIIYLFVFIVDLICIVLERELILLEPAHCRVSALRNRCCISREPHWHLSFTPEQKLTSGRVGMIKQALQFTHKQVVWELHDEDKAGCQ